MDWRNETAVCNAFVEAVHADNYALAGDARAALASERFVGTFSVIEGVVLTEENIPTHPDNVPCDMNEAFGGDSGIELLEGRVVPERLAVLMEGVGLIRFGGHLPYEGYDVQTDDRHSKAARQAPVHR